MSLTRAGSLDPRRVRGHAHRRRLAPAVILSCVHGEEVPMKPARMMVALLIALCAPNAWAQHAQCLAKRPVVYLSMDPAVAYPQREIAHRIAASVHQSNQTVLLRSDVIADFSDF